MGLGTQFGPYRLDDVVGRGGMGVVYRATNVASGQVVALKVMIDGAGDSTFRDRFVRESRIASSIEHPNVIPVFATGEHEGRLFIAMRFVEGRDLGQIIAGRPAGLEVGRAVGLMAQTAGALDAAHARGLVHRDVKPANILVAGLEPAEHVYLSDFGLTRLADGATQLTSTGQFVGTVAYCSPEQITGGRVGPASDVYALACVLFHSVSGRLPYDKDSEVALLYAHVHEPIPDLAAIAPYAPASLAAVVARALAKSPIERYASAGDLAHAANAALALPGSPGMRARPHPPPPVAPSGLAPGAGWTHQPSAIGPGAGWTPPVVPSAVAPGASRTPPVVPSADAPGGSWTPPWQPDALHSGAPATPPPAGAGRLDASHAGQPRWRPGALIAGALGVMAAVLSLVVVAGFVLFAADEIDRRPTDHRTRLSKFERVAPTAAGERVRERRSSAARESVDDVNDVLLAPFAGIAGSAGRWTARAAPTGLALLLYGVLLAGLARLASRLL